LGFTERTLEIGESLIIATLVVRILLQGIQSSATLQFLVDGVNQAFEAWEALRHPCPQKKTARCSSTARTIPIGMSGPSFTQRIYE